MPEDELCPISPRCLLPVAQLQGNLFVGGNPLPIPRRCPTGRQHTTHLGPPIAYRLPISSLLMAFANSFSSCAEAGSVNEAYCATTAGVGADSAAPVG